MLRLLGFWVSEYFTSRIESFNSLKHVKKEFVLDK